MNSIVEADFSLFPSPQRLAQETVIIDQRIGSIALGERDARILLGFASGASEPGQLQVAKLTLLVATYDVVRWTYDQETARVFLRSAQPHLGDEAIVTTLGAMEEATIEFTATEIQDATCMFLE